MHTLGYSFRPWTAERAIADGPSILRYVEDTAAELDLLPLVRLRHRVEAADWDGGRALWTVRVRRDGDEPVTMTCSFLWACSGYYRYDEGYLPELPGVGRFTGRVVHPQHWPPISTTRDGWSSSAAARRRSRWCRRWPPPPPRDDAAALADIRRLRAGGRPAGRAAAAAAARPARPAAVRWKNVLLATGFYQLSRRRPGLVRSLIRKGALRGLPPGYDVDTLSAPRTSRGTSGCA